MKIDFRAMLEVLGALIVIIGAFWGVFHYMNDIHADKVATQVKLLERDIKMDTRDATYHRRARDHHCEKVRKGSTDDYDHTACQYAEEEAQALMQQVEEDRELLKSLKAEQ